MAAQSFSNNGIGTLASPMLAGDATLSMVSAVGFPSTSPFTVLIDTELILVTSGAGTTTWGIARAQEGTAAAGHSVVANGVQQEWTVAGLNSLNQGYYPSWAVAGLTGAVAPARSVGGTASGAPGSGTFLVGDFVIDQTGILWICTVAGSPGTWVAGTGSRHAEVGLAAAQLIPSGVATKINFDTVESNDGNWSVSTHQYTCTLPGRYLTPVLWSWGSPQTTAQALAIFKNGSSYRVLDTPSPTVATGVMKGSTVCRAAAGDTLDVRVSQFTGANQGNGGGVVSNWAQFEYLGT